MQTFAGKVAVITGATKGIGLGIARHFAREGATLAICARSTEDLERVSGELT